MSATAARGDAQPASAATRPCLDALTRALEELEGTLTRLLVELVERSREARPSLI
jgi:hypothetical protein